MRNTAERIAGSIDRAIAAIGRAATWCCLYLVLAEFAVVVMRYALGIGSIRLQESVLYAHAALFMLAAAWTLQVGGHVRVDVFYAQASPRAARRHRPHRRRRLSVSVRDRGCGAVDALRRTVLGHP